jgi:hypothetical protein
MATIVTKGFEIMMIIMASTMTTITTIMNNTNAMKEAQC